MSIERLNIAYTLTFTTPFHLGTGIREGLVDRTVVRDGQGYLYVPGSTFKGMVREYCEQLARLYGLPVASPHDGRAALRWLGQSQPPLVTRVFGSQHLAGRLFFDDARQAGLSQFDGMKAGDGEYKGLQVGLTTQVRLDRLTRTAAPHALYTSEFGIRELAFQGVIQGWLDCIPIPELAEDGLTPTYSLLLLLAGLRMVERIGGNKSTGKGQCQCVITTLLLNNIPVPPQTQEAWLAEIDILGYYTKAKEE